MNTFSHTITLCPHCGYHATHVASEGCRAPKDGDYSICINCGQVSVFEANGQLRKMLPVESVEFLETITPEQAIVLAKIQERGPLPQLAGNNGKSH